MDELAFVLMYTGDEEGIAVMELGDLLVQWADPCVAVGMILASLYVGNVRVVDLTLAMMLVEKQGELGD